MSTFARWDGSGIMTRFCDELPLFGGGFLGANWGHFRGLGTQKGTSTCQYLFVFDSNYPILILLFIMKIIRFKGNSQNSST